MKNQLQKFLPHILAIVVFALIASIYFSPVISGNKLRQNDINHYTGMSKEIKDYQTITGERILWSNNMFSGMPTYQTSTVRDGNWLGTIGKIFRLGLPGPIGLIFCAMLGFYILCLCMKIDPWLSIVGAIGFGLASFFFLYLSAGHQTKMYALAYIPPTLGGVILVYRKKFLLGAAVTALFLGLHIYSNHLQVTYYLLFLLLAVGITKAIVAVINKEIPVFLKSSGVLVVAGLIGVLPSMTNLLLTSEYSEYTTRGKSELTINNDGSEKEAISKAGLDRGYILQYNMGAGELFASYIPNAKGGASGYIGYKQDNSTYPPTLKIDQSQLSEVKGNNKKILPQIAASSYWGKQSGTAGAFYYGAVIIFLFILGMVVSKNPLRWGFLAIVFLCMSLALKESSLGDWFIENFPMYNKFRDSKMILMLVQVILPFVGVLGINQLIKDKDNLEKYKKPVLITGGVVVLLTLLMTVAPKIFFDFYAMGDNDLHENVKTQLQDEALADSLMQDAVKIRVSIFKADALRTLLFVVMAFGVVLLFVYNKINKYILIPVLGLLIGIDMIGVDLRYLNNEQGKQEVITDKGKKKKESVYQNYSEAFERYYPYSPTQSDLGILDLEKGLVDDFDKIAKELSAKDEKHLSEKGNIRSGQEQLLKVAGEFGAVNMASNYRVFKMFSVFDPEGGRTQPNQLTQDAGLSFFHKSIDGYHGAKLKRYQDLIDFHIINENYFFLNAIRRTEMNKVLDSIPVLNMLNTKYFIIDPSKPPVVNPKANGNAWFVNEVEFVENPDLEILKVGEIDTKTKAVVDKRFQDEISITASADSTAFIEMTAYHPDLMTYESLSEKDQIAIFSEIYYEKGWKAYVDNEEVPIFRANYVLRGIGIPAGKHTIRFEFKPSKYGTGKAVASFGSVLVILLLLGGLFMEFKNRSEEA